MTVQDQDVISVTMCRTGMSFLKNHSHADSRGGGGGVQAGPYLMLFCISLMAQEPLLD